MALTAAVVATQQQQQQQHQAIAHRRQWEGGGVRAVGAFFRPMQCVCAYLLRGVSTAAGTQSHT
jgi:hypothetical protein